MDLHGRLKLCDFGSCFAVSDDGTVRTELHVGTPEYMAPEFIVAKRRRGGVNRAFTLVNYRPPVDRVIKLFFEEIDFISRSMAQDWSANRTHVG